MTNRSEKYFSEKLIFIDPSTLTLKELTAEIAEIRRTCPMPISSWTGTGKP